MINAIDSFGQEAGIISNNKLNKTGECIMDNVTMFNFKENWNLVEPHIYEPEILDLLDKGMSEYVSKDPDSNLPSWDRKNGLGPWEYSCTTGHWSDRAMDMANDSREWRDANKRLGKVLNFAGYKEEDFGCETEDPYLKKLNEDFWNHYNRIMRQFYPQPDSYEWYQCICAGCELAPWLKALAKRVFPDYSWVILDIINDKLRMLLDATVIGTAPDGKRMIFDILKFEHYPAEDILKCTRCSNCNCAA